MLSFKYIIDIRITAYMTVFSLPVVPRAKKQHKNTHRCPELCSQLSIPLFFSCRFSLALFVLLPSFFSSLLRVLFVVSFSFLKVLRFVRSTVNCSAWHLKMLLCFSAASLNLFSRSFSNTLTLTPQLLWLSLSHSPQSALCVISPCSSTHTHIHREREWERECVLQKGSWVNIWVAQCQIIIQGSMPAAAFSTSHSKTEFKKEHKVTLSNTPSLREIAW